MWRDARACLWDLREAADQILDGIAGVSFDTYAATPVVHAAVTGHRCGVGAKHPRLC